MARFKAVHTEAPEEVQLLALASDVAFRPRAMTELLARARRRSPAGAHDEIIAAVKECSKHVPQSTTTKLSCKWGEKEWRLKLVERQRIRPWRFQPPATSVGDPDRHPWEGSMGDITVGEFAAGAGCFLATAVQEGWTARWMAEPETGSQELARKNCPSCPQVMESIFDVDPADLPWVHLLLGGACCQPFSRAGAQQGWGDDRAYTTIRFLHNLAVMQPFVAVSENVRAMVSTHGGEVWEVMRGTIEGVGYELQAVEVCPTK